MKQSILFADSARGIYIPQHFAETAQRDKFKHISDSYYNVLSRGPDDFEYWDAWSDVLDNAETIDGGKLYQDGDLWVVYADEAADRANEAIEAAVEYEETHQDAGDSYAHCVAESWSESDTKNVVDWCVESKIKTHGLDGEAIADAAISCFKMVPGNMFWRQSIGDDLYLNSFGVGEIEIQHEQFGLDNITFDLIKDGLDAYVSGDFAYVSSDVVWHATCDAKTLQLEIDTLGN